MTVLSQEYHTRYPFVTCGRTFEVAICRVSHVSTNPVIRIIR